jgi:anti-anti-sigma factor
MQITRKRTRDYVEIELVGRLDGYWCDHLSATLDDVIREGGHHVRLDCAEVTFLTSAGVSVLVKCYRELGRINGSFRIVNPSNRVSTVLRIARLDTLLITPSVDAATAPLGEVPSRRMETNGVGFEVFDLDQLARLTCRAMGSPAPLATAAFLEEHCTSFESMTPALAVGIGAFGGSFSECRARFGELLSVAGATAYQPGDGTNVADYLVTTGSVGADVRLLYCLACEGRFSHLIRFEALQPGARVGLSQLLAGCLDTAETSSLGVVIVAEASGLVGAALRRSPTQLPEDGGFFSHPGVRTRLTFTAERAFGGSLALVAGVVTRARVADPPVAAQLRPVAPDVLGHFHAAAFRFRPLRKGNIELEATVAGLFEPDQLLGVLHLLNDDRGVAAAGESEFVSGACWIGRIADDSPAA